MDISNKIDIGILGEKVAAQYLKEKGFKILESNHRTEDGEIDLIARKKTLTTFIEVKTRTGDAFGEPGESIDFDKVDRIRRAAILFLKDNRPKNGYDARFDAVTVKIDKNRLKPLAAAGTQAVDSIAMKYKDFAAVEHIADAF